MLDMLPGETASAPAGVSAAGLPGAARPPLGGGDSTAPLGLAAPEICPGDIVMVDAPISGIALIEPDAVALAGPPAIPDAGVVPPRDKSGRSMRRGRLD